MNEAKRAYNIIRGYVGREWDRIKEFERSLAENELDEAMREPVKSEGSEDAVARATEDLERQVDRIGIARKLIGVPEDADFKTIRSKFEELKERSDPAKFPAGSKEQTQAEQIQKRAYWAYNVLTEHFDATEKRFRTLEIE